ncbi:hypothetical protein ATANTOWER_031219 [Ataeniobius toweri]|uniref:Uncharacterized protein n=1 Tax=Ataeniobius toweri TaxID=208326 RepID=A0ABU7BIV9_9TELE|nr:hypothetical protein [Ataeniobius toweri]
MEGHVRQELCKQLLKYARLWMCACVCTRGSSRSVNGTNGRGGPGRKEQACCYRGRTASLGRGLLHLGSCCTRNHTHTHTFCSPHPPTTSKHTVCCHAPEAKGRSSQNFSFANEVGRVRAEESRAAFIRLICVCDLRDADKQRDDERVTKKAAQFFFFFTRIYRRL